MKRNVGNEIIRVLEEAPEAVAVIDCGRPVRLELSRFSAL